MEGDDTGIQAEGRITQAEERITQNRTSASAARASQQPPPRFHRYWWDLLPWLTVSSMCLGYISIYFQAMIFIEAHKSTAPLSIAFARPWDRESVQFALLIAISAVSLGLLGYWLSRRAITRIEKELIYPRERPVTIESRLWGLIGVICGVLGIVTGTIMMRLS
jgi:hypothetical protein